MPLSFLSFLSFFFLFLFLLRDICLYSRSHRGPSKKETTVCVCLCVCVFGSLGGSARAGVSAQMMHRGQTLVLSPF